MIDDHFGSPPECEECEGTGLIVCPTCNGEDSESDPASDPCQCDGEGKIQCGDCDGDGYGQTPEQSRYERLCEHADHIRDERKDAQ